MKKLIRRCKTKSLTDLDFVLIVLVLPGASLALYVTFWGYPWLTY